MALTGNKGEWSELYALVKLLSSGKLYAADENTEKLLKPVDDKKYDDAIVIDVNNFAGIITGANERAVLIASYRFLYR